MTLSLRAHYIVPLPGGSEIRLESSTFQLQITPEYYSMSLQQSESTTTDIDVTSPDPVRLNLFKILKDRTSIASKGPIFINIIDDISGTIVYSGSSFYPSVDAIPTNIVKKI